MNKQQAPNAPELRFVSKMCRAPSTNTKSIFFGVEHLQPAIGHLDSNPACRSRVRSVALSAHRPRSSLPGHSGGLGLRAWAGSVARATGVTVPLRRCLQQFSENRVDASAYALPEVRSSVSCTSLGL